ncbi:MAG: hypothetical protein ACPG31_08635 [Planctomycetota bacterium]
MSRRLRLGILTAFAATCGLLLTLLLLYTFSRPGLRTRWDLSSTRNGGLSERTVQALQALPEGAKLTAFLLPEDESNRWFNSTVYPQAFQLLRALIDDAAVRSGGKLEVLILDQSSPLVAREREVNRLERQPGETLILEIDDNRRVLAFEELFQILRATPDGSPARILQERVEAALGDTAISLAAGSVPKAAIVTGYGQGEISDPSTLLPLAELLLRENWEVVAVQGPEEALTQEADLLIFAGQPRPFLPSDATAMEQWLVEDRPVLLALGPNAPAPAVDTWNTLLADRGTGFGDGLVCEPIRVLGELITGRSDNAQLEISGEQLSSQHAITRPLIEAKRFLLFVGIRPVTFESGSNDFTQERLVRSGPLAWIENPQGNLFSQDPGEPVGVVPMAVAAERWSAGVEGRHGRVVTLGSAEVLRSALTYNREFVAGALAWLHGGNDKERGLVGLGELPFRPERAAMARIHNISVFGIPGVTFLIGFWIYWRRRR